MSGTFGLALSGGGAKGLAHIGVLKVLEEAQIPVHLMAGTSMGGVIATMYAAGHSAAAIEEMARSTRVLNILQHDHTGLGLIGPGKIAALLRKALGGDPTFADLEIPLALIATDLVTGEEVILREGSVVEAVLATIAIPFIFPPVEWHGRLLADGGILKPVPDTQQPVEQRIEDADEVRRLLEGLQGTEAQVVRMYHLEAKNYYEISVAVGLSENSIGPILSRARAKMRGAGLNPASG